MEKSSSPLYKKILTAALCLLLVVYVVYHIALNFKKEAELFPVRRVAVKDTEVFTGYIFREGVTLTAYAGGNCYYPYEDGEKVGAGKVAAYVYRSASTALTSQIKDLEKQIDILRAGSRLAGTDAEDLQKEIDRLSYARSEMTAAGNIEAAELLGEEMLVYMAKKDLLTSGRSNYDTEITALQWQIESCLTALGSPAETVITAESGYFYRDADGAEQIFTIAAVQNLTLGNFDVITQTTAMAPGNAVGVLVTDHRWYYAAQTTASGAEGFTVGETYDCVFTDNAYTKSLPMTVYAKEIEGDKALIVFSCSHLPTGFDMQRCQRMEAVREETEGYRVPADEIRVLNGVTVVYIFKEGVAVPREVNIITEQNGYYIVSRDYAGTGTYAPLAENNLIIVGEERLYDGKIIG